MKALAQNPVAAGQDPPSIEDIRVLPGKGPWRSKSGGRVDVPFALPYAEMLQLFRHDPAELERIPVDIRGLRVFTLGDVPLGGIGGAEFHRLRSEVVFTTKGRFRWKFEDVYGGEKEILPAPGSALFIPPFIFHTIEAEEDGSSILVLANTLFVLDDPRTHDSYSEKAFRRLQRQYRDHTFVEDQNDIRS